MSIVNDLIDQISDTHLRERLTVEVNNLKKNKKFGIVFEEHIPEYTLLYGVTILPNTKVLLKSRENNEIWHVITILGAEAKCKNKITQEIKTFKISDLVMVAQFGDPIFPALKPIDKVKNGTDNEPWHVLIEADNYHALQLLAYTHEGAVDCVYIDPPYNTGARDWKYNNDYIDLTDGYRHSKWLSMIKKRLILAKHMLNSKKSVLIVTIDHNELHHLAILLEELFPSAMRQMVTICITPSGASGNGLSRVEEYAIFCFIGEAVPSTMDDDCLFESTAKQAYNIRWESLMRGGSSWYRTKRNNLCYPIVLNTEGDCIIGTGDPLPHHNDEKKDNEEEKKRPLNDKEGHPLAWPIRRDGKLGIWRLQQEKLKALMNEGYVYISAHDLAQENWTFRYLLEGTIKDIENEKIKIRGRGDQNQLLLERAESKKVVAKTMWVRGRHIAGGAWGTKLIRKILRTSNTFSFPKSLYSTKDALEVAVKNNPNALVVDFFAGSGTTLHAINLLNAEDGGQRQGILVTNNEVSEVEFKELKAKGYQPMDEEWVQRGICRSVTWPRTKYSILGKTADGNDISGYYELDREGNKRSLARGFSANVEYFELNFLDQNKVETGQEFSEILNILWLKTGAIGDRPELSCTELPEMLILNSNGFAVLLDEDKFNEFYLKVVNNDKIKTVYFVTNSEESFTEMSIRIAPICTYQMYRNYIDNFIMENKWGNL
jgi:adenine-specific DNA-methyltransferase